MNIPVGTVVEQRISFSEAGPFEKIKSLLQSDFDGYLVATVEGVLGLEEGLLMIKGNEIVGAVFDALRVGKQIYGVQALRLVFNLLKAKKGVFDVNSLSKQQIDLILAFNEKIKLPKAVALDMVPRLVPSAYRAELVSKELESGLGATESKNKLLKKLGLGSI